MANLLSGQPKVIPEFTGLQVNTSVQVLPIPIIYGSPRISVNLIYYNGFTSKKINQGGKGILSGGKGGQEIEYFATFIAAIGEGPIGQPVIIYQDQEVWTPATYPSNGAYYFSGSATQTPWSYIAGTWPNDSRPYKNTAYYGFSNAQIDSSATVPQINLVVKGFLQGTSPLNNSSITITSGQYDQNGNPLSYIGNIALGDADADPALVIYDFLTNSNYGATFPSSLIDTTTLYTSSSGYISTIGDQALSTYCQAVGLAWSVVINNAETANSILERWGKNLNIAIVWNGALLRFLPYWDSFASSNPGWDSGNGIALKYYNPYTVPITAITMDHIIQSGTKEEDPISFSRKDPLEVYNTIRLDFSDRTNFFNDVAVEAKDEVHAELFGPRVDNIGLADEYSLSTYANTAAQMILRRNISILRTFTWKMGPLWGWIDPMDIYTIPDPVNYSNTITVRIVSVEDDSDENITITAEEYPVGNQSPNIIPVSQTTPPNQGATNSPPSNIYAPIMFAVPSAMATATGFSTPQWIFGCSAGTGGYFDSNWGGVNIWISLDGVNYQPIGAMTGVSTIGNLSQPIPGYGGSNPDNAQTIYVNLTMSGTSLASVSSTLAANGYSICIMQDVSGFEIFSYTNATLISGDTYALTGLYRGLYGTTNRFFGAGSQFMLVNSPGTYFETNLPPNYVGQTFYVKAQSFNVFNSATEELSAVVPYVYVATSSTPSGPIPPPTINPVIRRIPSTVQSRVASKRRTH